MSVYGARARPINRRRRTRAEIDELRAAIYDTLRAGQPMTLRQLYYRLVVAGAIVKTQAEYQAVSRLLTDLRRDGTVPFR